MDLETNYHQQEKLQLKRLLPEYILISEIILKQDYINTAKDLHLFILKIVILLQDHLRQ